jgi:tRNA-specific 2-thiouridylase
MTIGENLLNRVRDAMGLAGAPSGHRVVVAMSGGVDSSVVAGLVKLAGFETVGITLQLYDHGEATRRKGACCAGQDIHDARRVAAQLHMPHYVLDFESRFREAVIDEFVDSYIKGETPIPCVTCNRTVKFADLLARAHDLGAAALATGHYVESRARADESGRRDLFTPSDMGRDQSYFLYATTQAQADYLRFPLGTLSKAETRQIAAELGLEVAAKPDSQDICFVPDGRYGELIRKLRPQAAEPGDIVHLDGRIMGRHEGIVHFTIGQRRGLGVADGAPLYVLKLDARRREVVVGPREALLQNEIILRNVNWLGERSLDSDGREIYVKVRSTRPPTLATISAWQDGARIRLAAGEYGVSPGQACVFYSGEGAGCRVLGGGTIAAAQKLPHPERILSQVGALAGS